MGVPPPDRNSFGGGDGVVFPLAKKGLNPSAADHTTGTGERVHGTKFTIMSARINGQYNVAAPVANPPYAMRKPGRC